MVDELQLEKRKKEQGLQLQLEHDTFVPLTGWIIRNLTRQHRPCTFAPLQHAYAAYIMHMIYCSCIHLYW